MSIFNGKNLDGWQGIGGDTSSYYAQKDQLICSEPAPRRPELDSGLGP